MRSGRARGFQNGPQPGSVHRARALFPVLSRPRSRRGRPKAQRPKRSCTNGCRPTPRLSRLRSPNAAGAPRARCPDAATGVGVAWPRVSRRASGRSSSLRAGARYGAGYELRVLPVAVGHAVGLTESQIAATAGPTAAERDQSERGGLLIRVADEPYEDTTTAIICGRSSRPVWSPQELLNLVVTAGWYRTNSQF